MSNNESETQRFQHLLAPSILLDRALTLATLLSIALDPVCSFTVILTFLKPELCNGANDRSMVTVDMAAEAELMFIRSTAVHRRDHRKERRLSRR